jgi:abortive infection bacteriophage resistance protein
MSKVPFSKPSTSPQQQVALLQSRGIKISDPDSAERFLQYHNYYHVSGYVFYFDVKQSIRTHTLARPVAFEDIIHLRYSQLSKNLGKLLIASWENSV